MKNKQGRQIIIKRLLTKERISNQEELLAMLNKEGLDSTQATLSRDLKELRVVKMHSADGGYYYSLPSASSAPEQADFKHVVSGILTIEISGQLCVVKTKPGYANMIGAVVDTDFSAGVMGCIAGDDTLLVLLKKEVSADKITSMLERVLPGAEKKLIAD